MISFDAIGQGAIGELAAAGDDVLIFAPSVSVTVSVAAPATNTIVAVPSAAASLTTSAPVVRAGKLVVPPAAVVSVQTFSPLISIGFTAQPATVQITVESPAPQIQSGNVIVVNNTVTMNTPYGEIASSSVGEFAIGEGEPSTRIAQVPPLIIVTANPPLVAAGKSQFPPSKTITVFPMRPEVDSRRRKLRVFAIAS